MLVQNELKISRILLMDLIEKYNFNPKSIGGANLDDLTNFKKNCESLYYKRNPDKSQKVPSDDRNDKSFWLIKPEPFDVAQYERQVLRPLKGEPIDTDYKEMSQQQIDDIITCAASKFLRAEYSLNFKYTDLNKVKNFLAFDSGVICFYPAPEPTFNIKSGDDFDIQYSAMAESNFFKNYGEKCPRHYDARCRDWYVQ